MFKSSFSRGREHLARLTKASKFHSDARNVSNKQVIYGIIGLNVGVFGAWTLADINPYLKKIMNNNFLLSYNGFWHNGRVHTLITAVFSHKSLIHLAENMFTLYFFGSSAIAVLGARQFLGLYFGGGIFSSLCAVTWPDLVPSFWPARWKSSRYASALGASGAVFAVVTWSILYNPFSLIMVIPVPSALFGVIYIANEVHGLYSGGTGTCHIAHLGGGAFGGLFFLRNFKRVLRR